MAKNPILPTDTTARALACEILAQSRFAALGVLDPESGAPFVSRIGFAMSPKGLPMTLISGLAVHSRALRKNPVCSLLLGEPPKKGDALAFPRLTVQAVAVDIGDSGNGELRAAYLQQHPKAKLYIDLPDFRFVQFSVKSALLNGGFGKAFLLSAADLQKKTGA